MDFGNGSTIASDWLASVIFLASNSKLYPATSASYRMNLGLDMTAPR